MINLLPTDHRQKIFYARRNTSLRSWIIAVLVVLAGMIIVVGAGFFYLQREVNRQTVSLEESKKQLQDQKIDEVRAQIDEISGNTRLVIQVLQREVLFSEVMRQIGAALPPNTALTQISLEDQVKGGITLTASATDITAASQIQINLDDPANKIFAKADLESISCEGTELPDYPCTVQIRALFNDKNPFVYIPPEGSNSGENQ